METSQMPPYLETVNNGTADSENELHSNDSEQNPDCSSDVYIYELYQVIVPTLFSAIILIGFLGNVLVIYVILSQPRLRTVTNLLLLNLAISDVAFLLICGSFTVVHYVLSEWPLGTVLCRVIQYLLYVSCYVTVYTLMSVSIVRYLTVVHGRHACFIRYRRNVIILIVFIWVVFLLGKIPILVVHGVSTNKITMRRECIITGKLEGQQLFASFFVFAYALPLTVVATLYLLIVRHMRRNRPNQLDDSISEDRQSHVTRVLTILVMTFAICWLPLHLHLLVSYYGTIPDSVAYKILLIVWHCLTFLNSMLNPVIYNFFSYDFRQSFKHVVCCHKRPASI